MNPFAKTLLAMTLAGTVAGAAQAQEKVLHVYNWSDYIAEDTLENFLHVGHHRHRLQRRQGQGRAG